MSPLIWTSRRVGNAPGSGPQPVQWQAVCHPLNLPRKRWVIACGRPGRPAPCSLSRPGAFAPGFDRLWRGMGRTCDCVGRKRARRLGTARKAPPLPSLQVIPSLAPRLLAAPERYEHHRRGSCCSRPHQLGSAKTHSTEPPSGFWISGVSVASALERLDPLPTATATYCLPLTL
jgi:hypothetical protein